MIDQGKMFLEDAYYIASNLQKKTFLSERLGKEFFNGKTVLDLGGGIGHIAAILQE